MRDAIQINSIETSPSFPEDMFPVSAAVFHLLLLPLKEIFEDVFLLACRIFQVSWNVINYSWPGIPVCPPSLRSKSSNFGTTWDTEVGLVKHLIIVRCFASPSAPEEPTNDIGSFNSLRPQFSLNK